MRKRNYRVEKAKYFDFVERKNTKNRIYVHVQRYFLIFENNEKQNTQTEPTIFPF